MRIAAWLGALALCAATEAANGTIVRVPFHGMASAYNVPTLRHGGFVFGEFEIDTAVPPYEAGLPTADYHYMQWSQSASIRLRTYGGFALDARIAVVVVNPKDALPGIERDEVFIQSFTGESPNDWHVALSFVRDDGSWLAGDPAQPLDYATATLDGASLEAWFTDEYETVRQLMIGALTFGEPPPRPVPLPAGVVLFGSAVGLLAGFRRRR